jgi:hypothetical protein
MTTNNKPLKDRRTLVSWRAPSRNFRNPNSEVSAKISETLETLGPKNQNAKKCNLKLVGGALKEVVHSYGNFSPVSALYTPGRRGRNLQSTRCVLRGK